jgi:fatty acid desaturase
MKYLADNTDPVSAATGTGGPIDRFFISLIRDKRDLPFVKLSLSITFTLIPLAVLLYWPHINRVTWWLAAVLYLYYNNFYFKGPYGLMLHCTSHRAFFKKEYNFLNHYLPWVLGPLFGQTPETYNTHHIGMHHPENNMPGDESSTMAYQRDSLRGFLHYFGMFFFLGIINLAGYFVRKKRNRVFILPFLISRVIMMMGNWAQHAFVSSTDPDNAYRNSITCINTRYNHKCWNDGYHISHHLKPNMHWTEHPGFFRKTLNEYTDNDAIVFDGIHFLHVFVYLMRKRYDLLAKHFVNIGDSYANDEAVIVFLKGRTKRIDISELQPI